MPWYELISIGKSDSDQIFADIQVPAKSPWFCGHFPEEPILPGIAQLGMVYDAVRQSNGLELKIANISRVRFKQMIRPGDRLKITAAPQKGRDNIFSFRITVAGAVACSGVLGFASKLEKGERSECLNGLKSKR